MNIYKAVTQYTVYRKSLGEKFFAGTNLLKSFVHNIGQKKDLINITPKQIDKFLAGNGPITSFWHIKHRTLCGFYRYVISRGFLKKSPMPMVIPKIQSTFAPYIYNVKELRALFDAALIYQKHKGQLDPYMVRIFLFFLYGTGMRVGEAIRLTLADVDLDQELITVRQTKFFKSRLVPIGIKLTQALSQYLIWRQQKGCSQTPQSPFFVGNNEKAVNLVTFQNAFRKIRKKTEIKRFDNSRYEPRIHDLRHTFAVHRLTAWYKNGSDVQRLLPILSVYLGHSELSSTSVYLTITPALLEEAGRRFQQYAFKENSHD